MLKPALLLTLLATPAMADEYISFHSPSGNIQCGIYIGNGSGVRCDMGELTPTYRQRPAGCEFDWGNSFAVDADSRKGYLACVSDSVVDENGMELGYGHSVTLGEFTCQSEKTGMTCTNGRGHGFSIAKAVQKLF